MELRNSCQHLASRICRVSSAGATAAAAELRGFAQDRDDPLGASDSEVCTRPPRLRQERPPGSHCAARRRRAVRQLRGRAAWRQGRYGQRSWLTRHPGGGRCPFPARPGFPLAAAAKRMLLAAGLLALSAAIVYLDRHGYRDAAHPGRPLSVVGSIYYAMVTLSTIGYGDIVPVTTAARLVNTVVITPMRLVFLIILVGTTLQVLTRQTRANWRNTRWRSTVTGQTIVIGYGTKGRSAVRTLRESGTARESIVVVDLLPEAASDANAAGLVAVTGDGTRRRGAEPRRDRLRPPSGHRREPRRHRRADHTHCPASSTRVSRSSRRSARRRTKTCSG